MSVGEDLLLRIGGDSTAAEKAATRAEISMRQYQTTVMRANAEMNADFAKRAAVEEAAAAKQVAAENEAAAAVREHQLMVMRATSEMEASFAKQAAAAEAAAVKQSAAMSKAGTGMLIAGGVMAAGLGLSAKAAVDWETAWAGVTKTTNGSASEMAELEVGLRNLSKTLPASHDEIAAVAEAAGQLGVQRESLLAFTKTMIDLGVSTNLTSDEAATGLAQLMNVMQTAPDDVGRLGAALVALGNNGASTEADILGMSTRLAAAGAQAGLSEADVLSFSNALASVGVESEAGGTAFSKVFTSIHDAVLDGNADLAKFAEVSGMTSAQFVQAYGKDAAGAVSSFVSGLGQVAASGQSTTSILDDLGFTDARLSRSLLSVAGAGDLLNSSIRTGRDAWEEQTALVNEANKRYETTASKLKVAQNQIDDAAITIGGNFLPVLSDMAGMLGDVADGFGKLPKGVQSATAAVAAGGAGLLIFGGSVLKVVSSLKTMGVTMAAVRSFILGPWGLALVAATAGATLLIASHEKQKEHIEELTTAIEADTGALGENTRAAVVNRLETEGALKAAQDLGLSMDVVTNAALGNSNALETVRAAVMAANAANLAYEQNLGAGVVTWGENSKAADTLSSSLGGLRGDITKSMAAAQRHFAALGDGATTMDAKATPATTRLSTAQQNLAGSIGLTGDALVDVDPKVLALATALGISADQASALNDSASTLNDTMQAMFDKAFAAQEAQDAFTKNLLEQKAAFDEAKKNGDAYSTALDHTTTAGIDNVTWLQSQVKAIELAAQKSAEQGAATKDVTTQLLANRKALEDQLIAMGFQPDAIHAITDALNGVPTVIQATFESRDAEKAKEDAEAVTKAAEAARGPFTTSIKADTGQALDRLAFLGGKLDGYDVTEHVNTPHLATGDVETKLRLLGGSMDAWTKHNYTNTPHLSTGDATTKLEKLGGALDEWKNQDYTAIGDINIERAQSALSDIKNAMMEFVGGSYVAHVQVELGGLGSTISDPSWPYAPPGGGRSYGQSYGDGSRSFGQQGAAERGAAAGTLSVPAGGDSMSRAFAQAMGAMQVPAAPHFTLVHNSPKAEPTSRVLAAASDHIAWFAS